MAPAKTAAKAKAARTAGAARPVSAPKSVSAAKTVKPKKEAGDFSAVWDDFLNRLSEAGKVLADPRAPHNQLDQAEGVRYLARLTRAALDQALESADPDFPRFFQLSNETIKIGADNPDNIYWNAVIKGDREYRVWGNKGDVPYLTFGTKENRYGIDGTMISTGELDAKDMKFGKDGSFEIIISQKKQGKNWLPSAAGSTGLIIRQTFMDKTKERPGTFHIEAINAPAKPKPITQEDLTRALSHTAAWVTGTAKTFADWSAMFMEHPNQILARDQKFFQRGGGDPNIFYGFAYFTLKDDEAWVIETKVPKCRLWNFQLCNWWMESLDYRTVDNVWTNQTKAKLEKDGTLKIVVAKKNPGLGGNWLDSTDHTNGVALLRWVGAKSHPVPKCSVVKLK